MVSATRIFVLLYLSLCRYLLFNLDSPSALVPLEPRITTIHSSIAGHLSETVARRFCVLTPPCPCIQNIWGMRIHDVLSASSTLLNSRPGHFLWRAWSAIGEPWNKSEIKRECSRNMHASSKFVSESYSAMRDHLTNYDLRVVLHAKYCDISFFDMWNQGTGRMTLWKKLGGT